MGKWVYTTLLLPYKGETGDKEKCQIQEENVNSIQQLRAEPSTGKTSMVDDS